MLSGLFLPPEESRAEIGAGDPMPPGPYAVSLYWSPGGWCEPYTVRSTVTGQAIAGHVPSRACADAIAEALNRATPLIVVP